MHLQRFPFDTATQTNRSLFLVRLRASLFYLFLIDFFLPVSLVNGGGISMTVALELCKYSVDVQADIYERHLSGKPTTYYGDWRNLTAREFVGRLENDYCNDLSRYRFDKSECAGCPFNTNCYSLFPDGDETLLSRMPARLKTSTVTTVFDTEKIEMLFPFCRPRPKAVPVQRNLIITFLGSAASRDSSSGCGYNDFGATRLLVIRN
jgi:hypothetical protein